MQTQPSDRQSPRSAVKPPTQRSHQSRQRFKPQISCNLCRRRKIRCDRQHPCYACTLRGFGASCTYPAHGRALAEPQQQHKQLAYVHKAAIANRVEQLEKALASVLKASTDGKSQASSGSDYAPKPDAPRGSRKATRQSSKITVSDGASLHSDRSVEFGYVNDSHWNAILDGIADIKVLLKDEVDAGSPTEQCDTPSGSGPILLLYNCKAATRDEILAAIPSRLCADAYISRYFNILDGGPAAIHSRRFIREYQEFWTNPENTPIMWVGLVYSMFSFSLLASDADTDGEIHDRYITVNMYREKMVQCLHLGGYTSPGPYVFETLYHYLILETSLRQDADRDAWVLLGMIVNIFQRMGYHRDPSHFPDVTAFEGEMRRRACATLIAGDILVSSQMGLPRMIKDWQWDTSEPRNLNDSDFDENTDILPPARPETEMTSTLYLIARKRMFQALGAAVDLTCTLQPCSYASIVAVDRTLHDALERIPPPFQMKPMSGSIIDSPHVILQRFVIAIMFQKGRMMLHRFWLGLGVSQQQADSNNLAKSYESCIDAALKILDIQQIMDIQTKPNGMLYTLRQRVTSFIKHEFLTATIVLCLFVHQSFKTDPPSASIILSKLEDINTALQKAYATWKKLRSSSLEARKVAKVVELTLERASLQAVSPSLLSLSMTDISIPLSMGSVNFDVFDNILSDQHFNTNFTEFLTPNAESLTNHVSKSDNQTMWWNCSFF